MPLVKRGAGKSENERPSKKRKKYVVQILWEKFYEIDWEYDLLDNIGYKADLHHSLFRELPDGTEEAYTLIARYIVSFLNSSGGILAFGVRPNGVIYGEKISRCEEDHLKCAIDEGVKRIIPYVPSDKYSVSFTPVKGRHFDDKPSTVRQVLEIRVNPGDPYELYEDPKHEAFTRNENRLIGPLTPHQIKDITIAKLKKRIRAEKELAEVLSPAKSSTITSKKLVTGEGHKAVATRALSSKERIAVDREKTSSSKSSLATVVTVSSKIPSGKSGREKTDSEIGKKAQVPLDLRSVGSTSGSAVTSKESSAANDGARIKPVSDNDSMSNKAKNISSSTALPSSNKVTDVVKDLKCTSVASTSSTTAISSASANPSTVAKSSTNTKPSTVAKSSVVTTSPTVAKPLTVGKPSAVTKLPTVAKPLAVAKPSTSKNVAEIKTSVAMKDKENCESKTSGTVRGTTKIAVSKPTNSITSQKSLAKPLSRKPLSIVNSSRATSTATHRPVVCSSNSFIRKKTVKLPPPPPPPPPSFSQPSYPNVRPQPTGLFSYQPSNYNLPQPHTLEWYWDRHLQCYVQM